MYTYKQSKKSYPELDSARASGEAGIFAFGFPGLSPTGKLKVLLATMFYIKSYFHINFLLCFEGAHWGAMEFSDRIMLNLLLNCTLDLDFQIQMQIKKITMALSNYT